MKGKTGLAAAALLLLLVMTAGAGRVAQGREEELPAVSVEKMSRGVKVVAHRGGAAKAPENTLAALRYAICEGADMAEIDLHMTRDGVLVALHDHTLTRTTGAELLVGAVDYVQLEGLDAGSWFSPEFAGEGIPTLAELLETAQGRIRLMLEFKAPQSREMLETALEQIRAMEMESECILAATNLELLALAKELAPEMETVYIGELAGGGLWELPYLDGGSIVLSGLTAGDVELAHQSGRQVYVWTVNTTQEMEQALAFGVDGLVTDDPALALEVLDADW